MISPMDHKIVSFNDLDFFTDEHIADIRDEEILFKNQSRGIDQLLYKTVDNQQKLQEMNSRLNYSRCLQDQLDFDISRISRNQTHLESLTNALEQNFQGDSLDSYCNCSKTATGFYRETIFQTAENVFTTLKTFNELADELLCETRAVYEYGRDDPFEAIAQLLMMHLDLLNQIEMKIQKLKNQADTTEQMARVTMKKFKVKENKIW